MRSLKTTTPQPVIKRKTTKLAINEVISSLIVIVCAMTSSVSVQAQSSASSIAPVLSLLLLSNSELSDIVDVDPWAGHSCVRLSNGTVKCLGYNRRGQLDNGTKVNKHTPVSVVTN